MAELKRQVALWIAGGMTEIDIAAVLGMQPEKLKAAFPRELAHGRAITRANLLARLDGAENVAADKRLLDEIQPTLAPPAAPRSSPGKKASADERAAAISAAGGAFAPPAAPRLGKKELAQSQARDAENGTLWEDLVKPDGESLQ